ncbi:MAG: hypothetical protein R3C59_08850 [Planctomycetaceae bacterium]
MATSNPITNPLTVLGLPQRASQEEIRSRYLELVKQFPPERDPERFREIRAAFDAANDPLVVARALLQPPDEVVPPWKDIIDQQSLRPPALSVDLLLSLGNRDKAATPDAESVNS